jgi:hypothetical protein
MTELITMEYAGGVDTHAVSIIMIWQSFNYDMAVVQLWSPLRRTGRQLLARHAAVDGDCRKHVWRGVSRVPGCSTAAQGVR